MTQTFSKTRAVAEIAFADAQSQFFARGHATEELDHIVEAREAKTIRLREARLAKEQEELERPKVAAPAKRARKS